MKRFFIILLAISFACISFAACKPSEPQGSGDSQGTTDQGDKRPDGITLPEQKPMSVSREGEEETFMASLAVSTQYDYAIYVLPDYKFIVRDGRDTIEPVSDSTEQPLYFMQLYPADTSAQAPQDSESDGYVNHYEQVTAGDKTIQVLFRYTPEAAEGGFAMLRAMADSIISSK